MDPILIVAIIAQLIDALIKNGVVTKEQVAEGFKKSDTLESVWDSLKPKEESNEQNQEPA